MVQKLYVVTRVCRYIWIYYCLSCSNHPIMEFRTYCYGNINTTVNDVGFISALIDTLKVHYDIDLSRVYCCGYSLGGEMTYRLAIELGYRFAAVASVTGLINDVSGNLGDPIRPIPILHIHGTADTYETWNGDSKNLWTVPETIDFWLEKNDCALPADTVSLPDLDPTDGCTVEKISYNNCSENSSFIFYKIQGGGHHWPDAAFNWGGGNLNRDINANVEIWNFFQNYQNPLVNLAYGKSLEVYPKYIPPQQGDTLKLSAQIINPENHQVTVHALIQGRNSPFIDSLQLFDDGLHNDSLASDNIFGGIKWFDEFDEDYFDISLRTTDLDESITTYNEGHFTTIGPVVFNYFTIIGSDTIANPGDRIYFKLTLTNNGSTTTANGITGSVSVDDTCVVISGSSGISIRSFGDIEAGESATNQVNYSLYINDTCLPDNDVVLHLSIASEGHYFWSDSFTVHVYPLGIAWEEGVLPEVYTLNQNYPNPFNPTTTLRYDLPEQAHVTLTIYDILGRQITTLVQGIQEPGFKSVVWDGKNDVGEPVSAGVYLYQIRAGEYVQTRKMILLR
ncbi:MAG: T9SS type A sorting domain-containing protein [Candidatus Marinimicrobia bacterium]|nr:T9SS type A sorting domain-containing protein [Candidatus Neomarinimicrobiota bacterium]